MILIYITHKKHKKLGDTVYKISFAVLRGESHIDFHTQCFIMTLVIEGAITNDVLKFKKVIEFQNSCIAICFSQIYLIIDGKSSFIT